MTTQVYKLIRLLAIFSILTGVMATATFVYVFFERSPHLQAAAPAAVAGVQVQAIAASSGAPPYLNYQGILRDQTGNLLSGQYNITFRLYDTVAGGTALWSESLSNIVVQDGRFSVLLGNTSPLSATHFSSVDRFIGVQVQGYAEMIPRQRLASVPFAFQATLADVATIANRAESIADGSVTTPKIANGVVTKEKLGSEVTVYQIDSGSVYGDLTTPGWNLRYGVGERRFTMDITFAKPFKSAPVVRATLMGFDIVGGSRLMVSEKNITPTGFQIEFGTWSDTSIYGLKANWIAYGVQ
jgi:hypothetical protein